MITARSYWQHKFLKCFDAHFIGLTATPFKQTFTDIFPGRADVPKTLIFAKDDSHADDIGRICCEVLGKGNEFCKRIAQQGGLGKAHQLFGAELPKLLDELNTVLIS